MLLLQSTHHCANFRGICLIFADSLFPLLGWKPCEKGRNPVGLIHSCNPSVIAHDQAHRSCSFVARMNEWINEWVHSLCLSLAATHALPALATYILLPYKGSKNSYVPRPHRGPLALLSLPPTHVLSFLISTDFTFRTGHGLAACSWGFNAGLFLGVDSFPD